MRTGSGGSAGGSGGSAGRSAGRSGRSAGGSAGSAVLVAESSLSFTLGLRLGTCALSGAHRDPIGTLTLPYYIYARERKKLLKTCAE